MSGGSVADGSPEEAWTAGHAKELDFQRAKLCKKFYSSVQSGLLPEEEASQAMGSQSFQDFLAQQRRNDDERIRARRRADAREAGGQVDWAAFRDKLVFISPDVDDPDRQLGFRAGAALSLRQTELHSSADVFIVRDISKLPDRVRWAAILKGGTILTPDLDKGPVLTFMASLKLRRWIFYTAAFAEKYAGIVKILRAVLVSFKGHQWKLLDTMERFMELRNKNGGDRRRFTVLGLATSREQEALSLTGKGGWEGGSQGAR